MRTKPCDLTHEIEYVMKRDALHNRCILLGMLIFFFVFSCSTTKRDWEGAQQLDTISSYQQFLEKHPESELANEAKYRIKKIEWQNVKTRDTIETYEQYMSQHPSGSYSTKAKKRIEELKWEKVIRENTIAVYEKYLFFNPNSKYKMEAHARINKIKDEAHLTIITLEEERKRNSIQHLTIMITDEPQKIFSSMAITRPLFSFSNEKPEVGGVKTIMISPAEGYTFLIAYFKIDPLDRLKVNLNQDAELIDSEGVISHPLVPYQPSLELILSINENMVTFSGNGPFNFECLYIIKRDSIKGAEISLWGEAFLVKEHMQ